MTKGVGKRAVGTLAGWRSGDGAADTRHLTPGPGGGGAARRPPFSQSVTRHCAPKLTLSRLCERSILEITIGSDVGPSALEDDGDALLKIDISDSFKCKMPIFCRGRFARKRLPGS